MSDYYSLKKLKKCDCDYNIILGQRTNGKSYAVKEEAITEAWNGNLMVYLRRWDTDIGKRKVEKYFNDAPVEKITKGKSNKIIYNGGDLLFANVKSLRETEIVKEAGYTMALTMESHYKSSNYGNTTNMIFEEFTSLSYLDDEVSFFNSCLSTVARDKKIKVWLIGNTISRLCPYFTEWELTEVLNQKQGEIQVYTRNTPEGNIITIGVEWTDTIPNNKMFFGKNINMITTGEWEAKPKPKLQGRYKDYKCLYSAILCRHNLMYKIDLLKGDYMFLFCHPVKKTYDVKRIITNEFSSNPLITPFLTPVTNGDKIMINLLKNDKICFSDNLTGTEFMTLLNDGNIL